MIVIVWVIKHFSTIFTFKKICRFAVFYVIGCQVINPNTRKLKAVFARSSPGDFSEKASRADFLPTIWPKRNKLPKTLFTGRALCWFSVLMNKRVWFAALMSNETQKASFQGHPTSIFGKYLSEDDLRSRIFGTFVVKFLLCLPLLGF